MYTPPTLARAASRGFDPVAHALALVSGDEDAIGLTHPSNWLTEGEVEALPLSIDQDGDEAEPEDYL